MVNTKEDQIIDLGFGVSFRREGGILHLDNDLIKEKDLHERNNNKN